MFYNIIDFESIYKHSYFGSKGNTSLLTCTETGNQVIPWEAGAADLITRYLSSFDSFRGILVAHDGGTAYRSSFYPAYKVGRKKREMSPLEIEQRGILKEWAKRLFAAIGATQFHLKGVEADDIIAWICEGEEVYGTIHTVDADLLQLVSDKISLNLKGEYYYDGDEYKGIPLNLTSISKSMLGDSSDDFGGVKGFGPKSFEKLVEEITFEGVKQLQTVIETRDRATLQAAVDSRPESKELAKLLAQWDEWQLGWRLAKLHPELCWKPRAGALVKPTVHKRVPNAERVKALLAEAGADDLYEEVFAAKMPNIMGINATEFEAMKDDILSEIKAGSKLAFDYETSDYKNIERFKRAANRKDFVDVLSHEISGGSFCFGEHGENVIYLPVDHAGTDNLTKEQFGGLLKEIQESGVQKIAHNFSFEGTITQTNFDGLILDNVHDTMIMQRYFDENAEAGLKMMSLTYLGYKQDSYDETLKAADADKMSDLTLEQVLKYGADDALVTFHLHDLLELMLKLDHQYKHYVTWAVEPSQVLQSAFIKGVNINWALQKRLHEKDLATIEENMASLRAILAENVNGGITEGCKSLIEEEKEYMTKRFKESHGSEWKSEFSKWVGKIEQGCVYVPYEEIIEEPKWSFTALQLTKAAVELELPEIEKTTLSGLAEYFQNLGLTKMKPTEYEGKQNEFLTLLQKAVKARVDKLPKEVTPERQQAFDNLKDFCIELLGLEGKVIKIGDELNVNSSNQMRALIYCKIGVPVDLFGTSLGKGRMDLGIFKAAPATDEKAIETALANRVEEGSWQEAALKHLLKIKTATTRINLFHAKMPDWVHEDGRIHPYVRDSGTDTRRPTGGNPNILQIPSRGEGHVMRSMYMPPEKDWVCVAIDFSGQELRIMASEAMDPVMIDAYTPGREKDIHSMTATAIAASRLGADHPLAQFEVLNLARKKEDHEFHAEADYFRGIAKGVNFLKSYLGEHKTLARNLMIKNEDAKAFLEDADKKYPRISVWQEEVSEFMLKNGFTKTAFGTKRHALPYLFSKNRGEVSRMLRQGVNATIQGCAAEALKTILTKLYLEQHIYSLRMEFFAPIYDEVVSFVHKDDVLKYWHVMKRLMTEATPPGHVIPQVPELSIGGNWGNCVELGSNPKDDDVLRIVGECLEREAEVWETDMKLTHADVFKTTTRSTQCA